MVYNQMWLSLPMDDCPFGYKQKLLKRTMSCTNHQETENLVYTTFASFYMASTFVTIKELGYLGSALLCATSDNN
jgi:hypothetical protein